MKHSLRVSRELQMNIVSDSLMAEPLTRIARACSRRPYVVEVQGERWREQGFVPAVQSGLEAGRGPSRGLPRRRRERPADRLFDLCSMVTSSGRLVQKLVRRAANQPG